MALVLAWWLPVATAIFAYLTPRMVGMFICMNMIFSVPLFILLWGNKDPKSCITKRRYRASWATLIGGFLMMIVLMIAMSAIESRKSRDKAEYLKMRESIVELFEQFATDLKNDQANAPNFDIAPRAKGEAGKAERWIRTFFYKVAQTRFEYYKAMAAAGSDEVTDFRNLKSPGVLQQRIQTAQKCLQLSVDYKNTIINLFDSNQKEIQTLDLKPEFRDGFQRGWNKSLGDGSAIRELSSYAPASWELFVQQLQLLARNPNHWNVEKNQIIFINHEDLIAFNANAKKIQMLQAKIGDSKNRTLAHGQELITDIKGLK